MNLSLLILFFLADNRKYMLSRWDFSVHVFCFRQCRKQANLISAVSFCYVYDLFLAKKKHSRLSVNSLITRECFSLER